MRGPGGTELADRIQAVLGAEYTLRHELRGGMSRVFVAEERALGRDVVLKVLPPELVLDTFFCLRTELVKPYHHLGECLIQFLNSLLVLLDPSLIDLVDMTLFKLRV